MENSKVWSRFDGDYNIDHYTEKDRDLTILLGMVEFNQNTGKYEACTFNVKGEPETIAFFPTCKEAKQAVENKLNPEPETYLELSIRNTIKDNLDKIDLISKKLGEVNTNLYKLSAITKTQDNFALLAETENHLIRSFNWLDKANKELERLIITNS